MATHKVEVPLTVTVVMDEMEGTPEQSAEVAMMIIEEQIRDHFMDAQIDYGFIKAAEA